MVKLDRESMGEDVRKRFDVLSYYKQCAVAAIMESEGYNIEKALDVVESGNYDYYPGITSMADLARELIHGHGWFNIDLDTLVKTGRYPDYNKLGSDLYDYGFFVTNYGVVRILR